MNKPPLSITPFTDFIQFLNAGLISFLLQKPVKCRVMALCRDDHSPPTQPCLYLVPPQLEADEVFLITSAFLFLAVGKAATLISAASRPEVSAGGE